MAKIHPPTKCPSEYLRIFELTHKVTEDAQAFDETQVNQFD